LLGSLGPSADLSPTLHRQPVHSQADGTRILTALLEQPTEVFSGVRRA